jgi:hypothetical protein
MLTGLCRITSPRAGARASFFSVPFVQDIAQTLTEQAFLPALQSVSLHQAAPQREPHALFLQGTDITCGS